MCCSLNIKGCYSRSICIFCNGIAGKTIPSITTRRGWLIFSHTTSTWIFFLHGMAESSRSLNKPIRWRRWGLWSNLDGWQKHSGSILDYLKQQNTNSIRFRCHIWLSIKCTMNTQNWCGIITGPKWPRISCHIH